MSNHFFARSFLSLLLIASLSLMNVSIVLADDTVPPTATAEPVQGPTQEPTQDTVLATEEPVQPTATEAPIVEETPVSSDPTPAVEEASPSTLFAQVPDETSIVVLDESGNPIPVVSQEGLDTILEDDPMWCPEGILPNGSGCTGNLTITALLTLMRTNTGGKFSANGVIYFERSGLTTYTSAFVLDNSSGSLGSAYDSIKNYNITLRGGWNGGATNSFSTTQSTVFDNNNNAVVRIGSSGNPWVGNATLQNIFVQDNTVANTSSIQVFTTNGSVTLNNADADNIDNSTAINVVVTGTGNVNLTGVDVSNGTDGSGITVTTNSGNITLADVDVTNQSDGYTANLQSQSGNISITNGTSNGSTFDGGTNSDGFVATTNTGSITITGAVGGGNQITFTDADGSANGATLSAPTVSLTRVTADNNAMNGIQISNANSITLNNVIATDNGTFVAGPDIGSGVRVIGTGTTVVGITGGTFSNNQRYPIEISNGTYSIINTAPIRTGNGESNNIIVDSTPPTMSPTMSCSLSGNAGWCRGTITINWNINDAQSAVNTTGCQTTFNTNTSAAGTTLTCSATSTGGTTTGSILVHRDGTAPNTTGTKSPAANGSGWNKTDVTVTFSGTDVNSGIASCTSPITVTTEGANQSVTGSCTDVAGNTDNDTVYVSIDKTSPIVNATIFPAPNANGWNDAGVFIIFSGTDSGSGVPFGGCNPQFSNIFTEGAGQTRTSTCTDRAGNTSTRTVTVNIDLTNPIAAATKSPAPNTYGWNNTNVVVTFSGTDTISGIASCTAPATVSTEGSNQSRTGTCTDMAGRVSNIATAGNINIDKTAPAITLLSRTPADANGWNNSDVTVTWSCTDALSGVVSSTISQTVSTDGSNQSATGTCQDKAGNTASNTVSGINIDKSGPVLNLPTNMTVEATSPAGTVVTYSASASDLVDGSVSVSCSPASGSTFPFGLTMINCSSTDDANNTTNGSFTITVQDTTPPVITPQADINSSIQNIFGSKKIYYSLPVTTDIVDGTGTATCIPTTGSPFKVGDTLVTCTAVDSHGNVATPITFTVHITLEQAALVDSAIIPVTGGETFELDCNTIVMINGIKVIFYNLCDQQAILTGMDANSLPGSLPEGFTFAGGLNVNVLEQGQLLDVLPAGAGVEMDFPAGNGQFAVLYWNNGQWVEISQTLNEADLANALSKDTDNELYKIISSQSGFTKALTTENTGIFILVKK